MCIHESCMEVSERAREMSVYSLKNTQLLGNHWQKPPALAKHSENCFPELLPISRYPDEELAAATEQ